MFELDNNSELLDKLDVLRYNLQRTEGGTQSKIATRIAEIENELRNRGVLDEEGNYR